MTEASPPPKDTVAPGLLTAAAIFLVAAHLLPLSGWEFERVSWSVWEALLEHITSGRLFTKGALEFFWWACVCLTWVLLTLASPFVHPWLSRSLLLWRLCLLSSCLVVATNWIYFVRFLGELECPVDLPFSVLFLIGSMLLNLLGLIAIRHRIVPW